MRSYGRRSAAAGSRHAPTAESTTSGNTSLERIGHLYAIEAEAKRASPEERLAALFYSLIESARLAGVEPRAYLRKATLRAVRHP